MAQYTLDGKQMTDVFSAHNHMAEVFGFPDDYDRSLDMLWDLLCEIPVPFQLSIVNWSQAEAGLEDYADELMELFGDLVEEEPDFTFDVSD